MKVLIVSQYFWPENFRINDLAAGLLERGHQITVYTGLPNYPEGRVYAGYRAFKPLREEHQGIRIIRSPLIPRGSGGAARIALNYLSFAVSASLLASVVCGRDYDLIFVFEPSPVTVGIPALVLKKLTKAPILFWVQDLWPESLVATGAVRSPWILRAVGQLVRYIYDRCDRILVTSRSFIDSVAERGADRAKIEYFPQYGEPVYRKLELPADAPERRLVPDGFVVMFAGNVGAAQDFVTILDAFERLKEYRDIQLVVIGEGRMKSWVEAEIVRRGLDSSVSLLGRYPVEAMPRFFSLADLLLVTLKKDPVFRLTVPAKIQSYLACGKPVLAALEGEGARIVREARAGVVVPCEDSSALAEAILLVRTKSAEERNLMGENGLRYYSEHFDRERLLDRLDGWMQQSKQDGKREGVHA